MPETVAAWIAANTLTAASVLTYGQIVGLTYAAFAAASVGLGNYQRRKAMRKARDGFNTSLQDRLVMTATASAVRSRVYGRARNVDGVLFKQTHGANKEFYTLVVAVAGHEVDAIETVYFNDKPVTLDGSGNVTSEPYAGFTRTSASANLVVTGGNGSVVLPFTPAAGTAQLAVLTTLPGTENESTYSIAGTLVGSTFSVTGAFADGTFTVAYEYDAPYSRARVRAYTGAPGQNLYPDLSALVGGAVVSTDRFEGVACLLVTLQYDQDAFATGVPSISAVMRGAKVYDPRTTVTGWTENPAIIARDWSLYAYGGGCSTGEVAEAAFIAAANACDTSTTFSTDAGPVTLPLYQCGIVVPLDSNPDEALAEICESMAGQWGWAGGQLRVRAGTYRAPVVTITEDWVTSAQDIEISPGVATADAVNVMRPTFADAANQYVAAPAAEVRAAAYITADGRELVQEVQLGGVTRAVHAQHVCGVLMRESRESLTLKLPCNMRAYQLELFDVVAVTLPRFGWTAKLFEVQGWQFSLTGGVLLTLRETAAAIYTPDANFDVLTTSANTGLPLPQQVPALTGLAVASGGILQQDGSSLARLRVTWSPVASEAVRQSGQIEVQVAEIAGGLPAGDWPTIAPVSGSATAADIPGLRIGYAVAVRARAVNTLGMRGPWRTVLHVVAGRRAPVVWRQASAPAVAPNGDHWFDTDDANKHYVREGGAWVSVRDTGIAQALADAADAQATADGKIATFYQASPPTAEGVGDIWFDTDDGNKQYRWSGSAWVPAVDARIGQAISDAADAQATADGKVTTFVSASAPTADAVGDLWLDSDDGNKLYRWSGSAWVALPVGTGGIAPGAATEVTMDEYDFAGAGTGSGSGVVQRSLVITPSVDSVVEVTGHISATNVVGDSGNRLGWQVTPAGGSALTLSQAPMSTTAKQVIPTTNSFLATGGVALTFELVSDQPGGNPGMAMSKSYLRITLVKR